MDTEKKVLKVAAYEILTLKSALTGTPLEYMLTPDTQLKATAIGDVQTRNLKRTPASFPQQQCGNTSVNHQPLVHLPQQFQGLGQNFKCLDPADLEERTRGQADSTEWAEARKERLTASNFHRVFIRKAKVTEHFLDSLFCSKTFSAPAVDYGKRNEIKVKSKYLETFPARHLHAYSLVVTIEFPFLGASPDGKVCDAGLTGIVEIKCPYASRNSTISEACDLRVFCLERNGESVQLKRSESIGEVLKMNINIYIHVAYLVPANCKVISGPGQSKRISISPFRKIALSI